MIFFYISALVVLEVKSIILTYIKKKLPTARSSCCLYQLPRWKTGSRDLGWKCRSDEELEPKSNRENCGYLSISMT